MGTTLVKSAFLVGQVREINHRSFRLLLHMAVTALDAESRGTPARLYWQGREAQAFALGYTASNCRTSGARSNVSKAVSELIDRGLIRKIDGGFNGRSATYELLLHGDQPSADLLLGRREVRTLEGLFEAPGDARGSAA